VPGLKTTYNAINADVEFQYSDDSEFCRARAFWPADNVGIAGIIVSFGTLAAQPSIWNADYDPDATYDSTAIDAYLTAGLAYVRVDFPINPETSVDSRHPYLRLPDNWRLAGKAIQYMKTHAEDGLLTGTKSVTLPTLASKYVVNGTSGGAHVAAMLAFAPDGALPYDSTAPWNLSPWTLRHSHRVAGCILYDFATADFRLFAGGVSAAAIPFLGVSERYYPDTRGVESIKRLATVSDEDKLTVSVMPLVEADYEENRHIGVFVNSSVQALEEASYLGSGATMQYASLSSGSATGAVKIRDKATPGSFATIMLALVGSDGQTYVYAEPDSATTIAMLTGKTIEFVSAGGTAIGEVTSYSIQGRDTQKTFVTKTAALATIDAAAGSPVPEFVTPHRIDFSAMLERARNTVMSRHSLDSVWKDAYYLGSAYPAQISGDTPAFPYNPTGTLAGTVVSWIQDELGMTL